MKLKLNPLCCLLFTVNAVIIIEDPKPKADNMEQAPGEFVLNCNPVKLEPEKLLICNSDVFSTDSPQYSVL